MKHTELYKQFSAKQIEFQNKLNELVRKVVDERQEHYSKKYGRVRPDSRYANELIKKYANYNTAIATGVGLVPGFLGIITSVPELALIVRNNLKMTYDLGYIFGHKKVLDEKLLVTMLLLAYDKKMQKVDYNLLNRYLKYQHQQLYEDTIRHLVINILLRIGRSLVCRWVPLLGAVALGVWTRAETRQLGNFLLPAFKQLEGSELDFLKHESRQSAPVLGQPPDSAPDYEAQEQELFELSLTDVPEEKPVLSPKQLLLEELKIKAMINLMKSDHQIHPNEKTYIEEILSKSHLSKTKHDELSRELDTPERFSIDFAPFKTNPDEVFGLMIDLVTLSHRDQYVTLPEKYYIEEVARQTGFSKDELQILLE